MKKARLDKMINGWFIGGFSPTLFSTNAVEVAVKEYSAGQTEQWHYHKIATEFTVIIAGNVEMNGVLFVKGDIIQIAPGEGTDFKAISDVVTVVVKMPGCLNDKYLN